MGKWEEVGIKNLPTSVVIDAENEVLRRARLKTKKEKQWARDMRIIGYTVAVCEFFVFLAILNCVDVDLDFAVQALIAIATTAIFSRFSECFIVPEEREDIIDILEEWGYL